jgi:hypothetical protein
VFQDQLNRAIFQGSPKAWYDHRMTAEGGIRVVIVTGLSRAGKAPPCARQDIGFLRHNVPLPLVPGLVGLSPATAPPTTWRWLVDSRQKDHLGQFHETVAALRAAGRRSDPVPQASDELLLRRFRPAPPPASGDDLTTGIRTDLAARSAARWRWSAHQPQSPAQGHHPGRYGPREGAWPDPLLRLQARAAGEADLVFDVRFLANPYFDAAVGLRTAATPRWPVRARLSEGEAGRASGIADRFLVALRARGQALPDRRHRLPAAPPLGRGGRSGPLGGNWDVLVRHRDLERVE